MRWLVDRADAEAEVADFGVGEGAAEFGQDVLFLEREFLHHGGVGHGDFERAAAELAGAAAGGEGFAGGRSPGGADVGVGLDPTVAALG